jgi:type I restriction enzyme S subunit
VSADKGKYKPYPKYKDSEIPWVGKIPEHWNVVPFFGEVDPCKRSNKGMVEDNLLSLSFGRIIRKDINTDGGLLPASFETYQIVEAGDEVFRLTDLQNDHRSLRSARVKERGIITSAYLAVTPKFKESAYFSYLMRSYDTTKVLYSMGGGLRQSLKFDDVRRLPVISPPPSEASAIADFIERECGRMDKLVAKKQEFIELLKEKRQALITHAVTKGLNPDVEMKDSGVEWLGRVPKHWDVKPFFSLMVQHKESNTGLKESNILSLSYGRVIRKRKTNEGLLPASYETYQIVKPGYMIFRLTDLQNDHKSLRSGLVTERGAITSAYLAVEPKIQQYKYFDYLFRGYDIIKVYYSMGGGLRQSLGFEDMRRLPLLLPPESEMKEIEAYVTKQTTRIDKLITKTQESIGLIKERKTALITAAVTGQIDVS